MTDTAKGEPRASYPFTFGALHDLKAHPLANIEYLAVVVAGPVNYPVCSSKPHFLVQEVFFDADSALRWSSERLQDGTGDSLVLLPARHLLVFPKDGHNWNNVSFQKEKLVQFHKLREERMRQDLQRQKALCRDTPTEVSSHATPETMESKSETHERKVDRKGPQIPKTLHCVSPSVKYTAATCCLGQIIPSTDGEPLLMFVGASSSSEELKKLGDLLTKNPHHYTGLRLGDLVAIKFNTWYTAEYSLERTGDKRWLLKEYVDDPRLPHVICD